MHEPWPLSWQVAALVALLLLSAFFSIAETAMMAINRYRLKHLVTQGQRSAVRVAELLKRTDRLLGGLLIGNTLVLVAASSLSSFIAIRLFGENRVVYAIGTLVISFLIIIFSEITPKVIGATYPERTALLLSYPLKATLRLLVPAAWFVNLFVRPLLWLLGIRTDPNLDTPKLSPEEIRTLVLESSSFMPKKHLSILLNVFDVGAVTVQDIMLPRARIEAIKLDDDMETISHQLATSHHMRLPVFRDALGEVLGLLHLRKVLSLLRTGRGHDAGPRHQPCARSQSSDRRTEDPQRADRRVPAGHPRGRRLPQDRQRADGNRARPGPDSENSAYLPAGRGGRKRRALRGLERVFEPLQTSSRGALSAHQPEGLFIWQQRQRQ